MIICPLNAGECNRLIQPRVKTVFIMAPSVKYQTAEARIVLQEIIQTLSDLNYNHEEGSTMVRHGDYFCSICRTVQGCALGIAMVYDDLPVRTISSIYLETGLMQGFGKPVILFVDKRKNLSSDYIRHYAIFFKSKDYLPKYRSLLGDIGKLPEDVYEEVARLALKAGDYEKAAKYYQEAYLIGPKHKILITLQSMASTLDKSTDIPRAYKQRLFENIEHFCSRVK